MKRVAWLALGVFLVGVAGEGFGADSAPVWSRVTAVATAFQVNYAGFSDSQFGISVGYAGEVHQTLDGGTHWPQAVNQSVCRFGLEIVDRRTAYHSGNQGEMGRSDDGGKTWTKLPNLGEGEPSHVRFLSFFNARAGWAASPFALDFTDDAGAHWSPVPLPEGVGLILSVARIGGSSGALFDDAGLLWTTTDAGHSWNKTALVPEEFLNEEQYTPVASLRLLDPSHVVLVFYRTGDAGAWVIR